MRICVSAGKHKAPAHAANGMAGILCRAAHEGASGVSRTDDNRIRVVPRKVPRISGDSGKPRSPKKTKERSNCTAVGKEKVQSNRPSGTSSKSPVWGCSKFGRSLVGRPRSRCRGSISRRSGRIPEARRAEPQAADRLTGGGSPDYSDVSRPQRLGKNRRCCPHLLDHTVTLFRHPCASKRKFLSSKVQFFRNSLLFALGSLL